MVALIPARAGSKRIPRKNTRCLGGNPLIFYTIWAAQQSGVFDRIVVSTDDLETGGFSLNSGAYYLPRWAEVTDEQPDIVWVREALKHFTGVGEPFDAFAVLRPTSPFRTAATIRRAYDTFTHAPDVDSMRAVQPVEEHPGKMWIWEGAGYPIKPLWNQAKDGDTPFHSRPTQTLPQVYVQNASLEMAWTRTVTQLGSIAGTKVLPFFTEGYEGVDLNTMDDWREAERLIKEGLVDLPSIPLARV